MRIRPLLTILGILLIALGLSMFVALLLALHYKEGDARSLLFSSAIGIAFGGCLLLAGSAPKGEITHREGFGVVALGWFLAAFLGALPYYLHGATASFVDAFFESASGFTTTGATIFGSVEDLPHGLLFWRSMTHWLGGMGIILLSLAILPLLGVGGMQLYRAEVPGPVADKLKPRIVETARTLWKVYVLITAMEVLLLMAGGMGPFDAVCHSFATLATGGFSTRNASIESFQGIYFEMVVLVFMLAAGINFSLHFRALQGSPLSYWRSTECRFFLGLFLFCTLGIALELRLSVVEELPQAFRLASFQVASILTTTGFTSTDYERWPIFSTSLLFLLMFIGGCSGSTGGAMKCLRVLVLIKSAFRELYRLVHPRAIIHLKVDGKGLPPDVIQSIWGFSILYLGIYLLASLTMALMGIDRITSFVSVAACIGNIGPGLGTVGPTENYQHLPVLGKWLLSFCMILGRLEIYTVIVLFLPEFWRK